jgi:hypothetical protein
MKKVTRAQKLQYHYKRYCNFDTEDLLFIKDKEASPTSPDEKWVIELILYNRKLKNTGAVKILKETDELLEKKQKSTPAPKQISYLQNKQETSCLFCNRKDTLNKRGVRRYEKLKKVRQRYYCKFCRRSFEVTIATIPN